MRKWEWFSIFVTLGGLLLPILLWFIIYPLITSDFVKGFSSVIFIMLGCLGIVMSVVYFYYGVMKRGKMSKERIVCKEVEIESIPTRNYSEVIQINVPVRFYFSNGEFDGIEFGAFQKPLQLWHEDMIERCLKAVGKAIGEKVEP